MKTSLLGPLRVRRWVKGGPSATPARLVIVLLHGFGAPGDDLVGLGEAIDVPAGTTFVFPEAPHSLKDFVFQPLMGDARAWWMIDMGAMERAIVRGEVRDLRTEVPEGLADARAGVVAMLDALEAEHDGTPEGERPRIVLGGFSQGAMLSLDVALRDPRRSLAGVVLLSGTLLAEREWVPLMSGRTSTPVFQSHGTVDPILPFSIAESLRDALTGAGVGITFEPFRGPHAIPPQVITRLSAWVRDLPSS